MEMSREWIPGQALCLDYGEQGHVRIPENRVRGATIEDRRFASGRRILDKSPVGAIPIVICDDAKIQQAMLFVEGTQRTA